jgi:hypothetical protein
VGIFIFWVQCLGAGRSVALMVTCLLPLTTWQGIDDGSWTWQIAPILRQVITSRLECLKKSSTYNNLASISATMVCNYNQTQGFSRRGQGPQSVFVNGRVHHYMRIASSILQNCGISYFLFWWYSISCRLCGCMKHWSCDTVKYLQSLRNEIHIALIYVFLE